MDTHPHWFATNPDKAWVEKFFLAYSPIWMLMMAIMMLTGWDKSWSDGALLVQSIVMVLPILLVPAFLAKRHGNIPWHQSYYFKVNLYLAVFGFFGNYIGSEYFFDLLGMVYNYPNATTSLDSALIGSGEQPVPVIMYFYTHAYFMTYHVTASMALRRLKSSGMPWMFVLFPVCVFVIGYGWAFAETKAMANPLMATSFYYEKMDLMLKYGSAIYATYFIASFPIYLALDEDKTKPWSNWVVIGAGFSASMLTLYMLDIAVHLLGSL